VFCKDCHLHQTGKVSHNHETNGRNAQKTAAENEREKIMTFLFHQISIRNYIQVEIRKEVLRITASTQKRERNKKSHEINYLGA
jgi:hypothetical protein